MALVLDGSAGSLVAQWLMGAAVAADSVQVLSPAVRCRGGGAQVKALLAVPLAAAILHCTRMQSRAKRCRQVQVAAMVATTVMMTEVAMMRVETDLSAAKAVALPPTVH